MAQLSSGGGTAWGGVGSSSQGGASSGGSGVDGSSSGGTAWGGTASGGAGSSSGGVGSASGGSSSSTTGGSSAIPECRTNAECMARATAAGDGSSVSAICVQSQCAKLASEDCKLLAGDVTDDNAILIGSLFPISSSTSTLSLQNSAQLAVEEIKGIPMMTGAGSRPVALVACDSSADLLRAGRHLANDLQVSAIIGPDGSQETLDLTQLVSIPAGVVTITPAATAASIGTLDDNDLVWQMPLTDAQQAQLLIENINRLEVSLALGRPLRLSVTYRDDLLGVGTKDALTAGLYTNGKSIADPNNAANVRLSSYSAKQTDYSTVVSAQTAFAPDIIVLAGGTESVTKLMTPIEQQWTASSRPNYLFLNLANGPQLLTAVTSNNNLRLRVRGIGISASSASTSVYLEFLMAYTSRFGSSSVAWFAGQTYSAVYALAYAFASSASSPPTNAEIVAGLRRLSGGALTVNVGSKDLTTAFIQLKSGKSVTGIGTDSALTWDSQGVPASGTVDTWCIGLSGSTPVFGSGGLSFRVDDHTFAGIYTPCGTLN